ncbi:mannose-1-phosphate guanylyltransferase [Campylobacter troglodytis]|uniref:mannose-1-phosphate guanylyltransferase n=1 Tax=Campylobacter troglodytis TaxID=654363 RepID=UPI001FE9D1B1|nr:sugar phosphate nucleotidyltransferase [Campylobacter troglodytis]
MNFLLEPLPKNTAAAITLSVLSLDKDELCLVSPSDHLIKNQAEYEKIILKAAQLAKQNFIVLLGIKPDTAQIGFGYIKMNDNGDVLGFYEKPDLKTAQKYLKEGNFFFNSGIFIFKASFFLKQMQKFAPKILKACEDALKNAIKESNLIRIKREDMEKIPENSIDYALMEKADKLKLIQAKFEWSDLGSFEALYDAFDKDKTGNVIKAKTLNLDSKGNFIYSSNAKKLIATSEIENLIIIDSEDALLLVPKSRAQRVKELVSRLDVASKFRKIHPSLGQLHGARK